MYIYIYYDYYCHCHYHYYCYFKLIIVIVIIMMCVCVCVLFFKAPPTLKCPNSWFQVPTLCCVLEIIQGLFLCHVSSSDLLERRWGREREGEGLHDWWFCTGVQFQTRMKRRGHTGLVFQSLIFLVNLLAWA